MLPTRSAARWPARSRASPRASLDADVVVALSPEQASGVVAALGSDLYTDEAALQRAVASGGSTNVIHHATGSKSIYSLPRRFSTGNSLPVDGRLPSMATHGSSIHRPGARIALSLRGELTARSVCNGQPVSRVSVL